VRAPRRRSRAHARPELTRGRVRPPDMLDDYRDSLDYLYGRLNYEWLGMPRLPADLRLGRMRRLLRLLGDPQESLRIIHVAGTKGKGSTSAMIAAALSASGIPTRPVCPPAPPPPRGTGSHA